MKRAVTRWQKSDAYLAIKNSRSLFHAQEFDIRAAKKTARFARILIITPRKSGSSVIRNLFRRRLKAVFQNLGLYKEAYDWFFFAKRDIAALSYQNLYDIVYKLFQTLPKEPLS